MFKASFSILYLIILSTIAFPQKVVHFVDSKTGNTVPYVIAKCNIISFISDSLGALELTKLTKICTTFKVSALGYREIEVTAPIPEIIALSSIELIQDSITILRNRTKTDLIKVLDVNSEVKAKYSDISEVVKYNSNLNIKDYGGISGLKTASMRGIGSENLLVLFNEVLINDIQSGSADLGKIPFFMIDKIEMGGNGYSSSGISAGGVLEMKTANNSSPNQLSILSKFSDIGHRELATVYSDKLSIFNIKIGLQRSYSSNEYDYQFESAELKRKNAFYSRAYSGIELSAIQSTYFFKGYLHYSEGVQGIPGFVVSNNTNSATSSQTTKQILGIINGSYEHSSNVSSFLTVSYQNQKLKITDSDHTIFRDRTEANGTYYSIQGNYKLDILLNKVEVSIFNRLIYNNLHDESEYYATNITEYGLTRYENKSGLNLFYNYSLNYSILSELALKAEYNFTYSTEKLSFKGVRSDNNFNSYSLGFDLSFLKDKSFLLHSNLFSSSRLPNFSERFYSNIFGYGELRNEDYYGYEVGLVYKNEVVIPTKITITFFNINGADKIIWQPVRFAIQVPKNISKVKSSGVEINTEFTALGNSLSLRLNYIYDDVRNVSNNSFQGDASDDKFLIYQPLHQLSSEFALNYNRLSLGVGTQYSSRRYFTSDNDLANSLSSFFVADFFSSYKFNLLSAEHSVGIKIYNLFNNNYSIIQSYPMPKTYITINYGVTI